MSPLHSLWRTDNFILKNHTECFLTRKRLILGTSITHTKFIFFILSRNHKMLDEMYLQGSPLRYTDVEGMFTIFPFLYLSLWVRKDDTNQEIVMIENRKSRKMIPEPDLRNQWGSHYQAVWSQRSHFAIPEPQYFSF